jgi:energy-converting hydrogenase Eha subunit F
MKIIKIFAALVVLLSINIRAQELISLYPGSIPNSRVSDKKETFKQGMYTAVTKPTLEIYLPEKEKATGAAVVICPGGGYSVVVYQAEGIRTAKEFAKNGVAAFVLKYRIPDDSTMILSRLLK